LNVRLEFTKIKNPAFAELISPASMTGLCLAQKDDHQARSVNACSLSFPLSLDDKDNPCAACQGQEDPVKNVLSLLDQRRREKREKTAC